MKTLLESLLLFFLVAATVEAQDVPSLTTALVPEQLVSLLQSGDSGQRHGASRLLGLSEPWEQENMCVQYEAVGLSKPRLKAGSESALLTAVSSDCDFMFLIVLVDVKGGWVHAGTVPIWTKYDSPRYRIETLIDSGESEIVVSGQTIDSGTGIMERNLTIFKVVKDSVRVIFDQPEMLNVSVPSRVGDRNLNFSDRESSTFTFVDSQPGLPGLKSIVEKRVVQMAGRSRTIYRRYVWSPALETFRMYPIGPLSGQTAQP